MATCSIKWCGRNKRKGSSYNQEGITFHKFPADPNIKNQWIEATRRVNWFPSHNSTICSRHFTDDCFHSLKDGRRRLYSNAVPSKHLPILSDEPETELKQQTPKKNAKKDGIDYYVTPSLTWGCTVPVNENLDPLNSTQSDSPTEEIMKTEPMSPEASSSTECDQDDSGKKEDKEPTTIAQFKLERRKLLRHIVELRGKINQKNKQLKRCRSKVGYYEKIVTNLKVIVKGKGVMSAETLELLNKFDMHKGDNGK